MSKKRSRYIFNENTLRFEQVKTKPVEKFVNVLLYFLGALVLAFLLMWAYTSLFHVPDARQLQAENDRLLRQYQLLQRKTSEMEKVLAQLEQRDDNMYRAILQASPIDERTLQYNAARYAELNDLTDRELVVRTTRSIDDLTKRLYVQSASYDELARLIRNNNDRLRHLPSIQPVKHALLKREASGYGWRVDPIYNVRRFHEGIDFSLPMGSDVYATADGVVSYVGYQRGGYGNLIIIDHGYGYQTRYAHLKNTNKVRKGQKVKRGDIIAESGHTGKSTAPHLHYEVRFNGKADNPIRYFFQDLSPEEYDDMLTHLSASGMPMD